MTNIDNIAVIRYIIIPSTGFFIGAILFLVVYLGYFRKFFERIEEYGEKYSANIFICAVIIYSLFYLIIISLRYYSHRLSFFDFGAYDWKIWQTHSFPWTEWPEKIQSAVTGHFQPILLIYSVLYDFNVEPVVLNIMQGLIVISAVIPLYLIAKAKLENNSLALLMSFFYLLYPATQFNVAMDFHPDNLIIPLLFWCYYSIETEKNVWLIPLAIVGYCIKEPLMLSFVFLGIFIVWDKKRYLPGFLLSAISLVTFFTVVFVILPGVTNWQPNETVTGGGTFGYLFESKGLAPILNEIFRFEKWRFPFFLLVPLLFLPLLKFKEFLPALPLLGIAIVSTVVHHQGVASQYTAGIIPPVFVAFISSVAYLRDRFGNRIVLGILLWVSILLLTFNIAHSPSPLAVAFWDKEWSQGNWHFTNYIHGIDTIEKEAIRLIPLDPEIKVVAHSRIYDKKLNHRHFIRPFPDKWNEADYVLLDNRRGWYVQDTVNEPMYKVELERLKESKNFGLIYDSSGVLLFQKVVN